MKETVQNYYQRQKEKALADNNPEPYFNAFLAMLSVDPESKQVQADLESAEVAGLDVNGFDFDMKNIVNYVVMPQIGGGGLMIDKELLQDLFRDAKNPNVEFDQKQREALLNLSVVEEDARLLNEDKATVEDKRRMLENSLQSPLYKQSLEVLSMGEPMYLLSVLNKETSPDPDNPRSILERIAEMPEYDDRFSFMDESAYKNQVNFIKDVVMQSDFKEQFIGLEEIIVNPNKEAMKEIMLSDYQDLITSLNVLSELAPFNKNIGVTMDQIIENDLSHSPKEQSIIKHNRKFPNSVERNNNFEGLSGVYQLNDVANKHRTGNLSRYASKLSTLQEIANTPDQQKLMNNLLILNMADKPEQSGLYSAETRAEFETEMGNRIQQGLDAAYSLVRPFKEMEERAEREKQQAREAHLREGSAPMTPFDNGRKMRMG